jgi:proteasome lid subunit RPN8/RPN11
VNVAFTKTALHGVLWRARIATGGVDGRETGGRLLGHVDDGRVLIVEADESASNRSVERCSLDLSERSDRPGLVVSGCWHSHPGNDPSPSDADIAAWKLAAQRSKSPVFAAAIVACPRFGEPDLHLWAVKATEDPQSLQPVQN